MGMERVAANFGALGAAGDDLIAIYGRFMGELDDMENDLRMLDTWDSAAAEQYREYKRAWNQLQAELSGLMAQLGPSVQQVNEIMQTVERQNANSW
jgi:early secretory antigenic target protein ESAT-6